MRTLSRRDPGRLLRAGDWNRAGRVLGRATLAGGPRSGPLVIEEAEATILVPPGATASLDATGSVILRIA